jgi:hypothetical protein
MEFVRRRAAAAMPWTGSPKAAGGQFKLDEVWRRAFNFCNARTIWPAPARLPDALG